MGSLVVICILFLQLVSAVPRQKRGTFCIMHGKDYPHGVNFTIPRSGPCIEYNCHYGAIRPVRLECHDGRGGCFPLGGETEINCKTAVCEERGNSMRFRVTHTKCKDQFGECHTIGEPWTTNCQDYVCRRAGPRRFRIRTLSIKCQDAYGNCQDRGESFSYQINGEFYNDCTCNLFGTRLRYECFS